MYDKNKKETQKTCSAQEENKGARKDQIQFKSNY